MNDIQKEKRHGKHPRLIYLHIAEILAIAVSFLQRSRIARFITAKLGMDTVVEVTRYFGPDAGHGLSTVLAAVIAEPKLIAVLVTVIIVLCNIVIHIVLLLQDRRKLKGRKRFDR